MRNKSTAFVALLSAVLAAVFVSADFDPPRWEHRAKISGGQGALPGFVVLELPSEIFSYLKADLSDLRVVNQDGEMPYVAAVEKEYGTFSSVSARMFNLSSVSGQSTAFIVDIGKSGVFHNSVTIETSSENFRRIVEIQGSDDQLSWRTINPKGQIFDYTVRDIKPVAVRDTTVPYPDSTVRYLKVTVFDQGEPPLKISGARVARNLAVAAREISYSPGREVSENDKERATDVILDLGAKGIPHRRGRIETSSANFSRSMAVYDSDDKENWRLLTNAYIFNISTPSFTGTNLDFSYPESNRRYLKLSIANRDDRPITVGGATLFGVVRRILFSFDPSKNNYLYLANPEAKRPQYDIERISQYVDAGSLNRVSVGAVERNPSFVPITPPKPPLSERSPYLLPTVLGVAVAVLAFLLLKVVQRAKGQDQPDNPSSGISSSPTTKV